MRTKLSKMLMFVVMLAMAISVMSMSTWATVTDEYTIALEPVSFTNNDSNEYYEFLSGDTVTYNIKLSTTKTTPVNITNIEFAVATPSGLTYSSAAVNSISAVERAANVYTFDMVGAGNDISWSGVTAEDGVYTKNIGTISFTVDSGVAANTKIAAGAILTGVNLTELDGNSPLYLASANGAALEINPSYTITYIDKTKGANGLLSDSTRGTTGTYTYADGLASVDAGAVIPGYTFSKWIVSSPGTYGWGEADSDFAAISAKSAMGDVTLKAVYTANEYTVTYDYDGGAKDDNFTLPADNKYKLTDIASADYLGITTTPTKNGYDFAGWKVTVSTEAGADVGGWTNNAVLHLNTSSVAGNWGNVTLTATWTIHTYTITLKNKTAGTNGIATETGTTDGTVTYTMSSGGTITIPAPDAINAYYFSGWELTNDNVNEATNPTSSTAPNWTAGQFNVASIDQTVNTTAAVTITQPTGGYYGDVTLIAVYTPISYTMTLAGNSGSFSVASVAYNIENVAMQYGGITAPTYTGYDLEGYKIAATASGKAGNWTVSTTTVPASIVAAGKYGDVTITAQWTIHTYTITLKNMVAGTNGIAEASITDGSKTYKMDDATITIDAPSAIAAYYFAGWELTSENASNASNVTSGIASNWTTATPQTFAATSVNTTSSTPTATTITAPEGGYYGDVTLVAVYTPITYTMTLAGTNTTFTVDSNTVSSLYYNITDVATKFSSLTPSRAGYRFDGYQIAATTDGKTGNWTVSTTTAPASIEAAGKYGDVTITAQWTMLGEGKSVDYAYAKTDTFSMVLFAIPTADVAGVYKYGDLTMYKVSSKYKSQFDTYSSTADAAVSIFATIVPVANAFGQEDAYSFTVVEGDNRNEAIKYNGNVYYGDNVVNTGDYGLVNNLLRASAALANLDSVDVKSRLEADMAVGDETTVETNFGSILDIKAVIAEAGKTIT